MDEAQQLLLWRWSTIVQLSSVVMVAAFFALLARSNPRPELKWWARAWAFNLLAIFFTSLFWVLQRDSFLPIVSLAYVAGKSTFALMLMQGTWAMIRPGSRLFSSRALTIVVTVYAVGAAAILRDVTTIGIAEHSLLGVMLVGFRSCCGARGPTACSGWRRALPCAACWRLDGFKQINDVHGHAAGDTCLKLFANALRESFRPDDHVVRYGGDEFLVVAPGLDTAAAQERVDELTRIMGPGSADGISCGFSVGIAELSPGGSPEMALQVADENMYKSKHQK